MEEDLLYEDGERTRSPEERREERREEVIREAAEDRRYIGDDFIVRDDPVREDITLFDGEFTVTHGGGFLPGGNDEPDNEAAGFQNFEDIVTDGGILKEIEEERREANRKVRIDGWPNLDDDQEARERGRIDNIRNVRNFLLLSPTSNVDRETKLMVQLYRHKLDISQLRKALNTPITELVPRIEEDALELVPRSLLDDANQEIERLSERVGELTARLNLIQSQLAAANAGSELSEAQRQALEAQAANLRAQLLALENLDPTVTVNVTNTGSPSAPAPPPPPAPAPAPPPAPAPAPAPTPTAPAPAPPPAPAPSDPTAPPPPDPGGDGIPTTPPPPVPGTDPITEDPNTPPDTGMPGSPNLPPFSNRLPDVSFISDVASSYPPYQQPPTRVAADIPVSGPVDGLGWEYTGPGYPRIYEIGTGVRRIEFDPVNALNAPVLLAPAQATAPWRPPHYPAMFIDPGNTQGSGYEYWVWLTPTGEYRRGTLAELDANTYANQQPSQFSQAFMDQLKRQLRYPRVQEPALYFNNSFGFSGNPPVQVVDRPWGDRYGFNAAGTPYAISTPTEPYAPWTDSNSPLYRFPVAWQSSVMDQNGYAYWIIEQDGRQWTYQPYPGYAYTQQPGVPFVTS